MRGPRRVRAGGRAAARWELDAVTDKVAKRVLESLMMMLVQASAGGRDHA